MQGTVLLPTYLIYVLTATNYPSLLNLYYIVIIYIIVKEIFSTSIATYKL